MRPNNYILNDTGEPVMENDLQTWARWFEKAERHVKDETFSIGGVDVRVSTVFLGLDHNWTGDYPVF